LRGNIDIVSGQIEFPATTFELPPTSIPVALSPGEEEVFDVHLVSTAVIENAIPPYFVKLEIIGKNFSTIQLHLSTLQSNLQLDHLRLLAILLNPAYRGVSSSQNILAQNGPEIETAETRAKDEALVLTGIAALQPITSELESLLDNPLGSQFQIGSFVHSEGLSTYVNWQITSRLQISGSALNLQNASLQIENLRLQLLLFDHMKVGQQLFLESMYYTPSQLSPKENAETSLRLKWRVFEQ